MPSTDEWTQWKDRGGLKWPEKECMKERGGERRFKVCFRCCIPAQLSLASFW